MALWSNRATTDESSPPDKANKTFLPTNSFLYLAIDSLAKSAIFQSG